MYSLYFGVEWKLEVFHYINCAWSSHSQVSVHDFFPTKMHELNECIPLLSLFFSFFEFLFFSPTFDQMVLYLTWTGNEGLWLCDVAWYKRWKKRKGEKKGFSVSGSFPLWYNYLCANMTMLIQGLIFCPWRQSINIPLAIPRYYCSEAMLLGKLNRRSPSLCTSLPYRSNLRYPNRFLNRLYMGLTSYSQHILVPSLLTFSPVSSFSWLHYSFSLYVFSPIRSFIVMLWA